jgi:hypothetical protein
VCCDWCVFMYGFVFSLGTTLLGCRDMDMDLRDVMAEAGSRGKSHHSTWSHRRQHQLPPTINTARVSCSPIPRSGSYVTRCLVGNPSHFSHSLRSPTYRAQLLASIDTMPQISREPVSLSLVPGRSLGMFMLGECSELSRLLSGSIRWSAC